jgi:hypothetical protein
MNWETSLLSMLAIGDIEDNFTVSSSQSPAAKSKRPLERYAAYLEKLGFFESLNLKRPPWCNVPAKRLPENLSAIDMYMNESCLEPIRLYLYIPEHAFLHESKGSIVRLTLD